MNAKLDLMLLLLCLFFCSFPHLPLSFHLSTELDCVLTTYQILSQGLDTPRRSELLRVTVQLIAFRIRLFFILFFKDESLQKISKEQTLYQKESFPALVSLL